jgi:hypothetical protein
VDSGPEASPIVWPVNGEHTARRGGSPVGAYGLVIAGVDGAAPWMQPQLPNAPEFRLHVIVGPSSDAPSALNRESADLLLIGGGRLQMERGRSEGFFTLPHRPTDDELLHPYLAPAAALFWQWSGREAIHAGGFVVADGAVLILGDKEAGKSTTLGWLARQGVPVVTDDLAVIDGRTVLAGPRTIDLRVRGDEDRPPAHLVRNGERDRILTAPIAGGLPLVGIAVLGWGPTIAFGSIGISERFNLIDRQRTFHANGMPPNPTAMLELSSVPVVRATRPHGLGELRHFGQALIDYFN